jgi:ATP-dependent Clp protease ATP-binding subunit ClpC
MTLANDIALRHQLDSVSELIVLIAMIEEGCGVAATILRELGVELASLYQHLPPGQTDLRIQDLTRHLPLSPECERVLRFSEGVIAEYGAPQVGTEHLLVALVRAVDTHAAALLAERGVTEVTIRQAVTRLLQPPGAS